MKTLFNNKKIYIFDLDGVILNIENINFIAYCSAIDSILNKPLSFQEYRENFQGKRFCDGINLFMRACSLENEIQNLRKRIGEKVFLHKKELLSRESLSKYTTKGIIPFLKFLKNKQYKIGLATSTTFFFVDIILNNLGITSSFDVILTSESVKHGKPSPEIYKLAFSSLGGTNNFYTGLVFEDSNDGIKSALDSGLCCIGIGEVPHTAFDGDKNYKFGGNDFGAFISYIV